MMRLAPSLAIVCIVGCSDDKAPGRTPDSGTVPEETPYLADAEEVDVPTTAPGDIADAIENAIHEVLAIEAAPVFAAYITAMAGMDDDCPQWATGDGNAYWYSTCTSADGTLFDGYGSLIIYEDYVDAEGMVYNGMQLYSISTVKPPDGTTFSASGIITDLTLRVSSEVSYDYRHIDGEFSWDGPEAAGTWLETDLDPSIVMTATAASTGGQWFTMDGAIDGLPGGGAVVFQNLSTTNTGSGAACTPEPRGYVSVLDNAGNWFDLQFSGASDSVAADPTIGCDGCAQAWYRGVDMGTVCPSFSPLYDWDGSRPWQ